MNPQKENADTAKGQTGKQNDWIVQWLSVTDIIDCECVQVAADIWGVFSQVERKRDVNFRICMF